MNDDTEAVRREMIATGQPSADLAADPDRKWTTAEMQAEFEVISFAAPLVVVRKRSTGELGSLKFVHSPRVYFAWLAHD
jgi:hypothetical protein